MPLANLPVELWNRIIHDAVGPANRISNSDFPWVHSHRSESFLREARKQRLHKLQSLAGVARSWRELCITLSYESFFVERRNKTPLGWHLNTQLPRFPSLFHRTHELVIHFPCPGFKLIDESIVLFVKLVGEMPVLQDLAVHTTPFRASHEYPLLEDGVIGALQLIGPRLLFLQIQRPMDRTLGGACVLTHRSVEIISALAPNLTQLVFSVQVDEPSWSDPAPSFLNLQILHMQLYAASSQQACVHNWIRRWQLGALKQFGMGYVGSPSTWKWVLIILAGSNGRNLEVFDLGATSSRTHITPALWTQCPNLHTVIGSGLQLYSLNLPLTHRPLKGLVYRGDARVLLQENLTQKHLLRELRDIDFAANTIVTFAERTWEDILRPEFDPPDRHPTPHSAINVLRAGIKAGLRFVDGNGETIHETFARVATGHGSL